LILLRFGFVTILVISFISTLLITIGIPGKY
jgi:hypothetical protein